MGRQAVTADQIVDVVANKALYPIPLQNAAARFKPIAALTRKSPAPEVVLMAGSGPGVRRIEIA